jgi:hypothetical protein
MKHHLEVTVPDRNSFYTLFADGNHSWKTYDRQKKSTLLYYAPGAVVILYYTYTTHREACVIRNISSDSSGTHNIMLPGLSKKVCLLFSVRASRVDKLKRAAGWLNMHSPLAAYGFDDGFYIRLCYLLEQRGKINYPALGKLAETSSVKNQNNLF